MLHDECMKAFQQHLVPLREGRPGGLPVQKIAQAAEDWLSDHGDPVLWAARWGEDTDEVSGCAHGDVTFYDPGVTKRRSQQTGIMLMYSKVRPSITDCVLGLRSRARTLRDQAAH
jgi:hypothetical protein